MPLTPEQKKLLKQTLEIRGSQVPLHRVVDILAMEDGDISQAVNRFRDVKNADLRRAMHNLALLLRELERDAGLQPAWEGGAGGSSSASPGVGAESGATQGAPSKPKAADKPKPSKAGKFSAAELKSFVSEEMRGKVEVAKAFVDGASKGNPGEAGIGVAITTMDGAKVAQISRAIGKATNNIAEYTALIEALKLAASLGIRSLFVLSDSELMVHQMNGVYKIKNLDLLKKVREAKALAKQFGRFTISHIRREHNTLADALSTAEIPKKAAPAEATAPGAAPPDAMEPLDDNPDEGATE